MGYVLGVDFGTSGVRAILVDEAKTPVWQIRVPLEQQTPAAWWMGLSTVLDQISEDWREGLRAIALNGTSGTVLLCDDRGQPISDTLLYNDSRANSVSPEVKQRVPPHHPAASSTSSFSKLIWFRQQSSLPPNTYFLHQADWLSFRLHGKLGISDYHNSLKLGYDPQSLRYPDWIPQDTPRLPEVVAPGTAIGTVTPDISQRFHLPRHCRVHAGTTDSIAAFLASGAHQPGDAVTSLGSTLVLKLLSCQRVDDGRYGVYSHRLGNLWLTGGASNTGGAVLQRFFSEAELQELSDRLPRGPSSLEYYPLLQPGERFPINDPNYPPQLDPKPDNSLEFLHGLLDSMARIEAEGYERLQNLGATELQRVYTAGGGAKNFAWMRLREVRLGVPVTRSLETEAAYGTALLALRSSLNSP
ncbi:FGGY-family carbohydrate kinase [Sodalinema gerasimenkoae]|uniref:FGGY-family carbohydrate kinase n=1 Tax=Sodalinema gerasimenkoae TaxID=2862348 RepID=UPI001359DA00|nr:FGGY-family carbohydrate kinase [Sodalinema gerasimenkoae]